MSKKIHDDAIIVVQKSRPTHVIFTLDFLKDYGWEKAAILGVVDYYGKCSPQDIAEALSFIPEERISFLLNEMAEQCVLRGVNV